MEATRTTRRTVTFSRLFTLSAFPETQPAGTYQVETDEVLLPTFTAAAYRRTATLMFLPAHPGSGGLAYHGGSRSHRTGECAREGCGGRVRKVDDRR